ncbi:MAG TPA: DUF1992 domain-containing protein [Acidimicrobiales bacterium]
MAERKPPGVRWETWIDRQIREGMERGEFDGLPGHGKPLRDLDKPRDDMWWVKDKLRRESLSYLPPTLAVRKELDDARARIAAATDEAKVRRIVADINAKIVAVNSRVTEGPPSTLVPLDVDEVVAEWAATRTDPSRRPEP